MKIAVFSTKPYDRKFLEAGNETFGHELTFLEPRLTLETCPLAAGFPAVCAFVNDELNSLVLEQLSEHGVRLIALRCAGFNNVDLHSASQFGITVVRVPAYSPYAVAEFTVGLILSVNRKLHRAYARVREGNFSLDGLLGFDLHGRTVGIIGTGKIGALTAKILSGFGCRLIGYDIHVNAEFESCGGSYVDLESLYRDSDIISLHCPLSPQTHHLINPSSIQQMKKGVMLINTSRGAIVDTNAVIDGLKSGKIGSMGMDVYEEEADLFFEDLSNHVMQDDRFARLLTFSNVLVTGHQAFFTQDALKQIADITLSNVSDIEAGRTCPNKLNAEELTGK